MSDPATLVPLSWDEIRMILGGGACLLGALLCIVGTIGVLRFPDFYTRLHAASITDTTGAGFLLLGMALMAPDGFVLVKIGCIFVFLLLTNVTSSHALASAALTAGLQPRIGPMGQSRFAEDEGA